MNAVRGCAVRKLRSDCQLEVETDVAMQCSQSAAQHAVSDTVLHCDPRCDVLTAPLDHAFESGLPMPYSSSAHMELAQRVQYALSTLCACRCQVQVKARQDGVGRPCRLHGQHEGG